MISEKMQEVLDRGEFAAIGREDYIRRLFGVAKKEGRNVQMYLTRYVRINGDMCVRERDERLFV